ncbi:MAG: hypothetical protein WCP21_12940 [Armatimonadota bacterium]
MSSLPSTSEMLGLVVAIAAALAFISYLMYAKGMDTGLSRRRTYRLLGELWVLIWGMLVLLFAARAFVGTPLLEGSVSEGIISPAQLAPAHWAAIAVAVAVIFAGLLYLRKIVLVLDPPRTHAKAKPLPPDQTC